MSALTISPSGNWWQWDGRWSTFNIEVGTPYNLQQAVFSSSLPIHLIISDLSKSTSWTPVNVENITLENYLGYDFDASYGFDNVTVAIGTGGLKSNTELLASPMDSSYQLSGALNFLGVYPTQNVLHSSYSGLLSGLKQNETIPSLSWGYTAGSGSRGYYTSLTLGGYDSAKMNGSAISYVMTDDTERFLSAQLKSITMGTNTSSSTQSLLSSPITAAIDSNLPYFWLTESDCTTIATALNLTYNSTYNIYSTTADRIAKLRSQATAFNFTFSDPSNSNNTLVIPFTYEDFWWNITPDVNVSLTYFPIKRASDPSQYVLGRMFLQNAYVIADFERRNFTLARRAWTQNTNLVDIAALPVPANTTSPTNGSSTASPTPTPTPVSHKLSGGAIAGIIIGALAGIALIAALAFLLLRRRRKAQKTTAAAAAAAARNPSGSTGSTGADPEDPNALQKPELDAAPTRWSFYAPQQQEKHEMPASREAQEMEATGASARPELAAERRRYELDSAHRPVEVEGRVVRHELE